MTSKYANSSTGMQTLHSIPSNSARKAGPAWLPNADSNICFSQRNTTTASVCMTQKQPIIRLRQITVPFHTHKNADITGALFREFRRQGLGISVYFSKPDWHSEYYWAPQFGTAPDRNVNYDVSEHPDLWEKYVQFAHQQIRELCTNYGKVDVLWLDGGWVRPDNLGQDIRLGEIVEEIRSSSQPHLIVSDRTCGGEYENFITPEKTVPETALSVPWETCTTVGTEVFVPLYGYIQKRTPACSASA